MGGSVFPRHPYNLILTTTKLRTNEVKNTVCENLKTIRPNSKYTGFKKCILQFFSYVIYKTVDDNLIYLLNYLRLFILNYSQVTAKKFKRCSK